MWYNLHNISMNNIIYLSYLLYDALAVQGEHGYEVIWEANSVLGMARKESLIV